MLSVATPILGQTTPPKKHAPAHHAGSSSAHSGKTVHHSVRARRAPAHVRHARTHRSARTAKSIARSRRLQRAFVASSQLRPMAQQLAQNRTPAAYSGVAHYAETHKD